MWFATELGLLKYDGYQSTIFKHDPLDPGSLTNDILRSIYEDRSGELWVGTWSALHRFDRASGSFIRYRNDPQDRTSISVGDVWAIYQDSAMTLWVGTTAASLNRFDRATESF